MDEIERLQPGTIEGLGAITITEKESNIPHFDIIKEDGTKATIMIQDNKYLDGSNTLTHNECEKLNEWVRSKDPSLPNDYTNWVKLVICWNGLYNDYEIDIGCEGVEYPNYSSIESYKRRR